MSCKVSFKCVVIFTKIVSRPLFNISHVEGYLQSIYEQCENVKSTGEFLLMSLFTFCFISIEEENLLITYN